MIEVHMVEGVCTYERFYLGRLISNAFDLENVAVTHA